MTSPDAFDHLTHTARIERVTELLSIEKNRLTDRNVKRHLDDGLLRRLYMLRHAAHVFRKIPSRGSKNPGVYFIIEVNTNINATAVRLT